MCVIFFAYETHPKYPLLLLANRDEFYNRPTAPAARWEDDLRIFAGRDLLAGGTWLGVTDTGRIAAVTNYREHNAPKGTASRGNLVAHFLRSDDPAENYLQAIADEADRYAGFNLIVGEFDRHKRELWYFSNRGAGVVKLQPGNYGLSNHLLNSAWPKVTNGLDRFKDLAAKPEIAKEDCFKLLADQTLAADDELPDTGLGLERERLLSSVFVRTPTYGTRSSTVVMLHNDLRWDFEEKVYV